MKRVFARISIGFAIPPGSPYMNGWSRKDRVAFKQRVTDVIHAGVPLLYRDRWLNVLLETDDAGHVSEPDVHGAIVAELEALNTDPVGGNPELMFQLKQTVPDVIQYYYVDEVRVCDHAYSVQVMPKNGNPKTDLEDWEVELTPSGQSQFKVGLQATLSWTSSVSAS